MFSVQARSLVTCSGVTAPPHIKLPAALQIAPCHITAAQHTHLSRTRLYTHYDSCSPSSGAQTSSCSGVTAPP